MVNCNSCFYNFDGICANHCHYQVSVTVHSSCVPFGYDIDPYGYEVSTLQGKDNFGCDGYRKKPSFLVDQER